MESPAEPDILWLWKSSQKLRLQVIREDMESYVEWVEPDILWLTYNSVGEVVQSRVLVSPNRPVGQGIDSSVGNQTCTTSTT